MGTKLGFLNHAVQINASAFHIDWTNIAECILYPICGFSFTSNLGKATSNGGDISLELRPFTGLDVQIGAAYTDAQFASTINLAGITKGAPLPFSPPWTGNARCAIYLANRCGQRLCASGYELHRFESWRIVCLAG